jgi:hypothetical protein
MIDAAQVTHDPARGRFEYQSGGATALLAYRIRDGRMILLHTEVPDELEGQGLGGQLVTAAVDYAAREGLAVVPLCPFAESWLDRHPDVAARVQIDEFR